MFKSLTTEQLYIILSLFLFLSLLLRRRFNAKMVKRFGVQTNKYEEPKKKSHFVKEHKRNISKQIIRELKTKGYRFRDEKRMKNFIKNNIHTETIQGITTAILKRGGKFGTRTFLFSARLERTSIKRRIYYKTVISRDVPEHLQTKNDQLNNK